MVLLGKFGHTSRFGLQPAECALATLRSSGPPLPGGCGPLGPGGPVPAPRTDAKKIRRISRPVNRVSIGLHSGKPAAKRTGVRRAARGCSPPPGAAAGCCGSFSEPQIQNEKIEIKMECSPFFSFQIQAATCEGTHKRTQRQTQDAGLRCREAAARSVLTDRPCTTHRSPKRYAK